VLTAVFLLVVGVLFSSIGIWLALTKSLSDAVPFLTIGGIGFIPGIYHVGIVVRACLGHPGDTYDMMYGFALLLPLLLLLCSLLASHTVGLSLCLSFSPALLLVCSPTYAEYDS
jgi:hypothetical protein